ncbi:MAG: hypothetical protein ABJG68_12645 [Crocinitomicaceae bacterium]
MRVKIQSEKQIQRINELINALGELKTIPEDNFIKAPTEKSWSGQEVIKHMSIAHKAYQSKIENALKIDDKVSEVGELECSIIPSFLIKRFPPIEGKVKFKMKTTKQFKPVAIDSSESVSDSIIELENCLLELKAWVIHFRTNKVSLLKFNSAVGALVRFNIPEACEFILCHNERHFLQLKNTLEKVN